MNSSLPPSDYERRIVSVEWEGRVKYTYYDDGIVKITRYKPRRRIYWGRVFIALVVFALLIMGIVQLFAAAFSAIRDDRSEIPANDSLAAQVQSQSQAADTSSDISENSADSALASSQAADSSSADSQYTAPASPYSNVSITVCIDPAHGDYDLGYTASDGTAESEQNLEMAMLVKEHLESAGVTVVMTRETDAAVSQSERCAAANQAAADFFITLHRAGSEGSISEYGVEIWVNSNQPQYDTALANNIMSALESVGISQNLGVKFGYDGIPDQNYQVNTDTVMPSCLIELGYITDAGDNALFEQNKAAYAAAIGDAVIKTAIDLGVVDESGSRLLAEQLISSGKNGVTQNY